MINYQKKMAPKINCYVKYWMTHQPWIVINEEVIVVLAVTNTRPCEERGGKNLDKKKLQILFTDYYTNLFFIFIFGKNFLGITRRKRGADTALPPCNLCPALVTTNGSDPETSLPPAEPLIDLTSPAQFSFRDWSRRGTHSLPLVQRLGRDLFIVIRTSPPTFKLKTNQNAFWLGW